MRVINVVVIKNYVVHEIESFGIFEEQFSQEVVEQAEELFKKKILEMGKLFTKDEIVDFLENGYYLNMSGSVCLTWSEL